jgi:hypothetical protein
LWSLFIQSISQLSIKPGEEAKKAGGNSGSDRMTENEKATATRPTSRQTGPQFIPKLRGKKVTIRLVSGGQPIIGTLEGYSPYEILIQTRKDRSWYSSTLLPRLKQWMNQLATGRLNHPAHYRQNS